MLSHDSRLEAKTLRPKRSWFPFGRQHGRNQRLTDPRRDTSIAGAVEFLLSVSKRKSVCFVVSDFFDEGYIKSLQMAARKHDVIAVLITDPRELELPQVGMLTLRDAETGAMLVPQYRLGQISPAICPGGSRTD